MEKEPRPEPLDPETERILDDASNATGSYDEGRRRLGMPEEDRSERELVGLSKVKTLREWNNLINEKQELFYNKALDIVEHPADYVGYVDSANTVIWLHDYGRPPSSDDLGAERSRAWKKHIFNNILGNNEDQKIG